MPSLRYIAHLVAPGLDVIGAGEPALPGISIGHNERIAFGLTIFAIDQEDLYVYETRPGSPGEYRYGDGWEPMTVVEEEVPVKDGAPERVTMRFTRHGPVIAADEGKRTRVRGPLGLVRAGHVGLLRLDLLHARRRLDRVPRRPAPLGRAAARTRSTPTRRAHRLEAVRAGAGAAATGTGCCPCRATAATSGTASWTPTCCPVERTRRAAGSPPPTPRTCRAATPTGERKLGFEWAAPFRLHRIQAVLRRERHGSLADSRRLQVDHRSSQAARIVPLLAHLEPRDRRTARAIRLLRRWDRVLAPESAAAALFEVWYSIELPTAVLRAALGSQDAVDAIWPGDPTVVLELLERPDRRLGRHPRRARDRALLSSLERAIDRTEALLGTRWSRWEWGKLHVARFEHPIAPAVSKALARRLRVGPVPVGGGDEVVGDTGFGGAPPPKGVEETRAWFEVASGASFRQVIDVGDWDRSLVINNPGQSGDPSSPHYRDLIGRWADGRAVPLLFSRDRVEAATERRILLVPAP